MSPHVVARLRIALVILVAILLETTLGSDVRVAQVAPDLMALVAICAGLAGGAEAGAWVGFWCGLVADLFLTSTPLGLSALTFCLVGAGVGALRANVLPESRMVTPLAAVAGTVVAALLFVVAGDVLGQSQLLGSGKAWLLRVILIEAGWAAVLSLPVSWLYNRAARGSVGADRTGTGGRGGTRIDRAPAR